MINLPNQIPFSDIIMLVFFFEKFKRILTKEGINCQLQFVFHHFTPNQLARVKNGMKSTILFRACVDFHRDITMHVPINGQFVYITTIALEMWRHGWLAKKEKLDLPAARFYFIWFIKKLFYFILWLKNSYIVDKCRNRILIQMMATLFVSNRTSSAQSITCTNSHLTNKITILASIWRLEFSCELLSTGGSWEWNVRELVYDVLSIFAIASVLVTKYFVLSKEVWCLIQYEISKIQLARSTFQILFLILWNFMTCSFIDIS